MSRLKVIELRHLLTAEIYWRASGSGFPPNTIPTGREGFVVMEQEVH